MIRARPVSFLLILALGLMSVGFGMARGQVTTGEMVLCTGQGVVVVSTDASGGPVKSHSLCPDAALSAFAVWVPAPASAKPVRLSFTRMVRPHGRPAMARPRSSAAVARGPPPSRALA